MTSVTYWINDGHWNLNEGHAHDRNTTWFNGTVDTTNTSATLTTVQLCGGSVYPATGEPYYNSMDFNGDLLIYDAADGCGEDEWGNSWCGEWSAFDIDEWDVSDYLRSSDNNATFDRGTDTYPTSGNCSLESQAVVLQRTLSKPISRWCTREYTAKRELRTERNARLRSEARCMANH